MLLLLLSAGICSLSHAQESQRKVRDKSKIFLPDSPQPLKGVLYSMDDSAIWIFPYLRNSRAVSDSAALGLVSVPVASIKSIRIKRRGNVAKGVILRALGGFAAGTLIALLEGDDPPCASSWCFFQMTAGEKVKLYGAGLALPGILTGGLIGIKREKFLLQGNLEQYALHREVLKQYTLLEQ